MNLTISKKLFAGCGALAAISLLMGGLAIHNVTNLGDEVQQLGHHYVRLVFLAGDIDNLTTDMQVRVRGILLRVRMKDMETAGKHHAAFASDMTKLKQESAEFMSSTTKTELRELLQNAVVNKLPELQSEEATMYELAVKGDSAGAESYLNDKLMPLTDAVSNDADHLFQLESQSASAHADEASGLVAPARYTSMVMICLALGVTCVVIYVVRGINKTLASSATELRECADQVSSAASQVSSSSQSLAQGSSEQAASLEETSASSEEINSMARKNTDNSKATAELLAQSQSKVNLANQHLADMVQSMNEITESSGKISKIIKVIDEIAFQTNILALNAAVEAARAGEAGMGFAVVADEVRSLAQRSAQAAKDTATLIEDSIAKSSEGKGKVDLVAAAIQAVTEDTARIKVMVDEVSLGSEEQSNGIEQVGRAIVQMEQVTQTTAANAEESAAAAEELNAQSETMKDVVGRLFAMIDDNHHHEPRMTSRSTPARSITPAAPRSTKPAASSFASTARMKPSSPIREEKTNLFAANEFPLEESFKSF